MNHKRENFSHQSSVFQQLSWWNPFYHGKIPPPWDMEGHLNKRCDLLMGNQHSVILTHWHALKSPLFPKCSVVLTITSEERWWKMACFSQRAVYLESKFTPLTWLIIGVCITEAIMCNSIWRTSGFGPVTKPTRNLKIRRVIQSVII